MNDIRKYFKYLYSLERSSMKYDLNNIKLLLESAGNPHLNTKFIHIAGTNGKGGTASFLSSILIEHGFKTGLFTSPHILRFNERIRINGNTIPDSYVIRFLDTYKKSINKIKPSFFEVNTALAFKYFKDKNVDVAVIEAGLGGRLDSTNVIKPELTIITQISIDHTEYLGNTLEKIAKEKLGIVKPDIDVIVSDTNKNLINLFVDSINPGRLYFLDEHIKANPVNRKSNVYMFKRLNEIKSYNLTLTSRLPGTYQARNIAASLLGAEKYLEKYNIKFRLNYVKRAVKNVQSNAGFRCRFETFKINGVNYILDISHNAAGIKSALDNVSNSKPDVVIFAMMNDKNYNEAIDDILKIGSKVVFTQPEYKRAVPARELFEYAKINKFVKKENLYLTYKVSGAIEKAKNLTGKNGYILIIGSFFLISEAIKSLKIKKLFK